MLVEPQVTVLERRQAMSLGTPELVLILIIVLLIFGAGKLPQVFSQLGRGVKEFREASDSKETPTNPPAQPALPANPPESPQGEVPAEAPREAGDPVVKQ